MTISANFPNVQPSLLLDFANAKQLPPSVNFTRATTATYYDGHTTAKAEQNLLLYSQSFGQSAWVKTLTLTSSTETAPDGTSTAYLMTGNQGAYVNQSLSSADLTQTYGVSVYAKAGTASVIRLYAYKLSGGNNGYVDFDLSAGTAGSPLGSFPPSNVSIVAVGSGWYRCSFTASPVSGSGGLGVVVYQQSAGTGLTFSMWGFQVEQRSAVTAYTATTTQAITNYIPVLLTAGGGQPRFDHNPTTGESLGLLIEEQRTNSLLYSGAINSTNWLITQASADANTIVAPDGTLTGSKIYVGSGLTQGNAYVTPTYTYGSANTGSVYFKAGEFGWVVLELRGTDNSQKSAWFNLLTGVVGTVASGVTATITPVGNGWYRCTVSAVLSSGASTTRYRIYPTNGDNTYTTGNGFSGIYAWGAQLETGASFATSYIATTSSQVTRAADAASMTGTNFSSWYSAGEGTIYAEAQLNYAPIGGGGVSFYSIDDTSASTNVIQPYFSNSSGVLYSFIAVGGVEQANTGNTVISAGASFKHAQAYRVNDFASVVNGGTVSTDASGTIPVVTQLQFSNGRSKYYKKFAYYPLRVTNAQLQALTS